MDKMLDIFIGFGLSGVDGDFLFIVKVQLIYLCRVFFCGIEGYVILEFMVIKNGLVKDLVVVEVNLIGIFDLAVINVVLKFKYKFRIVDGVFVDVVGV